MAKHAKHESATPATEWLKAHGVTFREFSYDYVEHGGTHKASESLGLDEHATIKTLIMENESAKPLVILMHGDCDTPCKPEQAQRNSGYMVGGTSPFGTRKKMPVYVQKTILELPEIFINGGRRGYIVGIPSSVLTEKLGAVPVDVALEQ